MNKDDFFYLGKITKPHGYKGAMVLFLDVDDPSLYHHLDGIFLDIRGQLIPHFIQRADPRAKQLIIELEGVEGAEMAEAMRNVEAYLPIDLLPKLSGIQFYYHEVIGFELLDVEYGSVGQITHIVEHASNPLFAVDHDGIELLLPMRDEHMVKVDREAKQITVKAPEGLIDVYLGNANERDED
ncbi:MAG: ribosome maturation factor RimM [Flavobacteriales bacterium]|nr:ribosome maturation factor RimM [Flavobacteriales bacterium]